MTDFQKLVLAEIQHKNKNFGWGFQPENKKQKMACEKLESTGHCKFKKGDRYKSGYWLTE